MTVRDAVVETTEYAVALVLTDSRMILARAEHDGYRLPIVEVLRWSRPAEQLQSKIMEMYGVHALILDILPCDNSSIECVVARVLASGPTCQLSPVQADRLIGNGLEEKQRAGLRMILDDVVIGTFSRLGWIDNAISWVERSTGTLIASDDAIRQYNASRAFSLIRFRTEDGQHYWLKATGEPNVHERSVTLRLTELCHEFLPEIVATRGDWNAWLMRSGGTSSREMPNDPRALLEVLEGAVVSMANLQMRTEGHGLTLLAAGAFDQGTDAMLSRSEQLFDYLAESMALQTSNKAPRLSTTRLRAIRAALEQALRRMEALGMADTVIHGDLNAGNILSTEGAFRFIDWAEAYVGNPVVSLQNLLLLNRTRDTAVHHAINARLTKRYAEEWGPRYLPGVLSEAFVYMPTLAVASTLFGRGDWLDSAERNAPGRRSYARTLTRCLDRAIRVPEFEEALCQ